jgi:hypothetical protein
MRTTHRRHSTSAYLPVGCATLTGPIILLFIVLGTITLIWFVAHLAAILSTILVLAAIGNSLAAMLGLVCLGYALLTHRRIVSPAAHYAVPSSNVQVYQPKAVKPEPVYWDGRRVGWEDAAGVLHFDHKTPA